MVAWDRAAARLSPRLAGVIALLAAEAAVAIERADLLARLEAIARTDDLTGLANRRAWDELLPTELARARRDEAPLCVAMLDLDRFKAFNDQHGHQAGDRLLKAAAGVWRGSLRATDALARYGGEEFAVVLPRCDVESAVALIDRLRASTPDEQTASAGIAQWDGEEAAEALVARADAALYEAKNAGRDRVMVAAADGITASPGTTYET
jgi:diguanylate cyclase (GGDEF)-like protein